MNAPAVTPELAPPPPGAAVVLFDGVCNLCNGWVNFLIDRDPRATLRFAALQSRAAGALLASAGAAAPWTGPGAAPPAVPAAAPPATMLLVEGGRVYDRSTAVLRIVQHLGAPWSLLAAFLWFPRPWRDGIYAFVAARRYRWFGKSESCRIPTPELRARFLPEPAEG
jgi:predicted DCC family thiol-disulfide oxidoreductase YuxK